MASADDFDRWLAAHGADERERILAIYKKASERQTVTFDELLDVVRPVTRTRLGGGRRRSRHHSASHE